MRKIIFYIILLFLSLNSYSQIIKGNISNKPSTGYGLDTILVTGVVNYNQLGQSGVYLRVANNYALVKLKNNNLCFSDNTTSELNLSEIATKTELSEALSNVIIDNSALWVQSSSEIITNTSNQVIVSNLEIRKSNISEKTILSNEYVISSGNYTYLDSIYLEPNKIAHLQVIALAHSIATAGTFEIKVSFSNLNGAVSQISTYGFFHVQRDDNEWNFTYDVNGNYIRFKAKGRQDIPVNWSYKTILTTN